MKTTLQYLKSLFLLLIVQQLMAQEPILEIDASNYQAEIAPTMYGIFFEDINFAADGGLYAELVKNRSFEFTLPKMGWLEPNSDRHSYNSESGISMVVQQSIKATNTNFLRVQVTNAKGYELINEGFRGMGIKKNESYDFSISCANPLGITKIIAEIIDEDKKVIGCTSIEPRIGQWTSYETSFKVSATVEKAQLRLRFEGKGSIDIDFVSLFPQDTWKGRKKGLRKDLVRLIDDLNPGFLRFPGGCIVEGRTLERRYQWKKTVGPVADRTSLINRWNTEFNHRLTPDYFQSFGIGFFEYFQLAEDLGAAPLPILGCGMACQFNTGELVPMDELDPYIQDALDLIEFANGSKDTPWGKLRHVMGHPEPFNMKYIGIGNEQWGPEYIKRYKEFDKAIKAQYPEIIVVSGSGPFPDGDFFEYGWKELKELNAAIVDEHYYRSPEWFRANADRYDSYDRNGPKVFAGEYAAQSVAIASPENENNWDCALSEAAFMTGIERNADLVTMTSYAPLMAHTEGWQWKTDLIWFNNLTSYGTPSYYVQKMYGQNAGTQLLHTVLNGEKAIGQENLYASSVFDEKTNEIIVKVVNTNTNTNKIKIDLKGRSVEPQIVTETLAYPELDAVNSIAFPSKISTKISEQPWNTKTNRITLAAQSFTVIKFKLN
ncbi:MAG: alpha-L-arabinofuranosidase C-terminal domain-containing protein [Flavobacteriaceae bacterium]|nr:alpha-L-arabinofuranosidase C-terminal domain-containing protein [Flavobacteriaceae bacterium]